MTFCLPDHGAAGSKAKILLIEDMPDLAQVIRRELEAAGYQIVHASDGRSAVRLHEKERPDHLILDWMLPQLDGLEVLRRIRRTSAVPVGSAEAATGDRLSGACVDHPAADVVDLFMVTQSDKWSKFFSWSWPAYAFFRRGSRFSTGRAAAGHGWWGDSRIDCDVDRLTARNRLAVTNVINWRHLNGAEVRCRQPLQHDGVAVTGSNS